MSATWQHTLARRRHRHWETRLVAWAEGVRGTPFAWGRWDCVTLAFRALDVMLAAPATDSLAARWVGRWHDRRTALAAARLTTLEDELLCAGADAYNPRWAQPGDVLVLTGRPFPRASVLLGRHQLAVTPRHGVEVFALGNVLARGDVLAMRIV